MNNMVNYVPMPVYQAGMGKPRKTLINNTNVPAFDRACNVNYYCSHNCSYCWIRGLAKFRGDIKEEQEWKVPLLVPNALELVEKEIPRLQPGTRIHLSFMTDPYMFGYPEIAATSTAIIRNLNEAGFSCFVLSKGILPGELAKFPPWVDGLDFDMLSSLLNEIQFADHIIFGRANHIAGVNSGGDYRSFYGKAASIVSEFCEVHGITFQIKLGTVT